MPIRMSCAGRLFDMEKIDSNVELFTVQASAFPKTACFQGEERPVLRGVFSTGPPRSERRGYSLTRSPKRKMYEGTRFFKRS
jgi:hypothetical protein